MDNTTAAPYRPPIESTTGDILKEIQGQATAETPVETPVVETKVEAKAEVPEAQTKEVPAPSSEDTAVEEKDVPSQELLAGKFKTVEEQSKAYLELESKFTRQAQERAELQREIGTKIGLLQDQSTPQSPYASLPPEQRDAMDQLTNLMMPVIDRKVEERLKPLEVERATEKVQRELDAIIEEFPDAKEMKDKILEFGNKPEYLRTPLKDIYKILTYDQAKDAGKNEAYGNIDKKIAQMPERPSIEGESERPIEELAGDLSTKDLRTLLLKTQGGIKP